MILNHLIWMLSIASCDILRVVLESVFYTLVKEVYKLSATLMLIGPALWMIDVQLLDIVPLLEVT